MPPNPNPNPNPQPNPNPPPNPNAQPPFHLNIIEDPLKRTAATKAIIEDTQLSGQLKLKQTVLRVFSANNQAEMTKYNFNKAINDVGLPLVILQDKTGAGLIIQKLPDTKDGLLKLLAPYIGN